MYKGTMQSYEKYGLKGVINRVNPEATRLWEEVNLVIIERQRELFEVLKEWWNSSSNPGYSHFSNFYCFVEAYEGCLIEVLILFPMQQEVVVHAEDGEIWNLFLEKDSLGIGLEIGKRFIDLKGFEEKSNSFTMSNYSFFRFGADCNLKKAEVKSLDDIPW